MKKVTRTVLDKWFGAADYTVLHEWTDGDTSYVVVKVLDMLQFVRIFTIGDKPQISIDNYMKYGV